MTRSRAASRATRHAVDAVSWMTPFHDSGSAVSSRSHSTTTSSTSVSAGADCQVMPSAPSPAVARSPSAELRVALDGNQPK